MKEAKKNVRSSRWSNKELLLEEEGKGNESHVVSKEDQNNANRIPASLDHLYYVRLGTGVKEEKKIFALV